MNRRSRMLLGAAGLAVLGVWLGAGQFAARPAAKALPVATAEKPAKDPAPEPASIVDEKSAALATEAPPEVPSRMQPGAASDLFMAASWYVAPPPPPPEPPAKPVAPPFPYVFLGKRLDGNSVTLFLGQGERTFIVRNGGTIGANYRFDEVVDGNAIFTYLPLKEKQQLAIGNNS